MGEKRQVLYFVTSNQDKLRDAVSVFGNLDFDLRPKKAELLEIQGTPEEIALFKCAEALKLIHDGDGVIIEDTALCMDALGGMPGPYIKYFKDRMKPNDLYRMLKDFQNHRAQVISTVAFAIPSTDSFENKNIQIFQSVVHGKIVPAKGIQGDSGGWDPVFLPDGSDLTYAEMTTERQHFCARKLALSQLKNSLNKPT